MVSGEDELESDAMVSGDLEHLLRLDGIDHRRFSRAFVDDPATTKTDKTEAFSDRREISERVSKRRGRGNTSSIAMEIEG